MLKKGAERRDTGARTNLDRRTRQARRPSEAVGLLHMDAEPAARLDALTQKGLGDTKTLALAEPIAHRLDRSLDHAGIGRIDEHRHGARDMAADLEHLLQ